jgi:hypothetical protein
VERDAQPLTVRIPYGTDGQLPRFVDGKNCLLKAIWIYLLAEIPLLIKKPDPNKWNAQVAGCLELISSDIAQPAGIDRECFA